MDGTLVNSVDDIADSMNHVLSNNNFPTYPIKNYINWIGDGMKNLVISALPFEKRHDTIINKCVEEMKAVYALMWNHKTHLYPGISETLAILKERKIKLAILSNKPHKFTQLIAEKLFTKGTFDAVVGYREGYQRKPDPSVALEIANTTNLDPSNYLYLGDSSTDMKTAINAGMYPVGVSWGYRSTESLIESGAKKIINNPNELISFF